MIEQFISAMKAQGLNPARNSDIIETSESRLIQDDKGKRTIYYSFEQQDGRAWGHWYNCRTGEGDFWHSKSSRKWTQEEKDAWTKSQKEKRQEIERKRAEQYEAVAEKVKLEFLSLPVCQNNKYLERKGVKPCANLRQNEHGLQVPAIDETGKIWTLQTISDDGDKLFTYGGRKSGTFFPINLKSKDQPERIYICEGLATALSVHEATNGSVCVAWDAGNLLQAATSIRMAWPGARLVFCADNDDKGDGTRNTGLFYAEQAAGRFGRAFVVMPDEAGCDWNDIANKYGLERLAEVFSKTSVEVSGNEVISVASVADTEYIEPYEPLEMAYHMPEIDNAEVKLRDDGNPAWFDELIWDKPVVRKLSSMYEIADHHDGKSLSNRVVFIKNYWRGLFVLNEFSDEVTVRSAPPWLNREERNKFKIHRLTDADVNQLVCTMEHYGFSPDKDKTRTAIMTVAAMDKVHPARKYFSALKWDGEHRLGGWLKRYCGAVSQPAEYLGTIGTMWLVAGVKRIFEPGAKFDHMLVLEGGQGIGKSSVFRELATFGDDVLESYFTDSVTMHEIDKPAALRILQGKLIIEFSELEGMDKAGDEQLKRWITKQEDELLKKYENDVTKYPRQFIIGGTTNNDMWLRDGTGNRRYWPVKCTRIDMDGIREIKTQLWAEAVELYNAGYKIYLDDQSPIYEAAMEQQKLRVMGDSWVDVLRDKLSMDEALSYKDIYEYLGIRIEARNRDTDNRIRRMMLSCGYEYTRDYSKTKRKDWVWVKK